MTPSVRTLQGSKIKSFKGSSSLCPRGSNSRGFSTQYSELQLQAEWSIGRKVIRRLIDEMESVGLVEVQKSTVASTVTFPFVRSWTVNGMLIDNPYHRDYLKHATIGEGGNNL